MAEKVSIVAKVTHNLKYEERWSCRFEVWKKLIYNSRVDRGA